MHLNFITLSGQLVDEDVFEVVVPTIAGDIAINDGHAPLLGEVAPGIMEVRKKRGDKDGERQEYGVYEGTVEVLENTVRVLVDDVDNPDDVSESEAKAALERAQKLIDTAKVAVALCEAQSMMDRQAVRLKLATLRKRPKRR